jgi:hypothetical protein
MSKHISRKARWTQVNSKEYRSAFGVVRYHAGAWEGALHYELRETADQTMESWRAESESAGRFKRPRNAMMAVEDKAREIRRRYHDQARIAFEG